MIGKVKSVTSRGFGFIETDNGIDWFFHHSQLIDYDWKKLVAMFVLDKPITVSFDKDGSAVDGPRALQVRVLSDIDSVL